MMNEHDRPPIRACERIEVIRTISLRGRGVEGSPCREVMTYWSMDGERLAESDPFDRIEHDPTR